MPILIVIADPRSNRTTIHAPVDPSGLRMWIQSVFLGQDPHRRQMQQPEANPQLAGSGPQDVQQQQHQQPQLDLRRQQQDQLQQQHAQQQLHQQPSREGGISGGGDVGGKDHFDCNVPVADVLSMMERAGFKVKSVAQYTDRNLAFTVRAESDDLKKLGIFYGPQQQFFN